MRSDFNVRLGQIKRVAKERFDDCILIHAPHYTLHGSEHSNSIEGHLHDFLLAHSDKPKLKLNDYENFLLISAVWLHDIGMTYAKYEGENPETIRKEHHKRSQYMILKRNFQKELGLKSLEGDIVAKISFLHRRDEDIIETFKSYEELSYPDGTRYYGKPMNHNGKRFEINCEKLAMLLRILDACDRDHKRAKDIDTITEIAKLPKESIMHHYVHSLIDNVDFNETEIILHSHIYGEKDQNMINELVCNDIKREIDSLEPLLKKYDLHGLFVKQVSSQISGNGLPEKLHEYYVLWRNKHLCWPEVKIKYFLIEKNVYISKSGHAIIEYMYDALVNDSVDSFPHAFSADDSTPPDFRFSSLQTMEKEPLENRFTKQTFFYRIFGYNLNEPISISAIERKNIGDPFRYKEFDLKFDKEFKENTRIGYGWGYSASDFFDVKNHQVSMTSKYISFCDITKMIFSISFERGLNITELRFLVLGEDDKESLYMKLDKAKSEYTSEGIFKYNTINNIVSKKHIVEIEDPERKRSFVIKWRFKKGE